MNKNTATIIPLGKITTAPTDRTADDGLVASVKQRGILQAVALVPHGDGYRSVFGTRRIDAARKAGLSAIPAIVYHGLSATDERIICLVENCQREDQSPLTEGRLFAELVELGLSLAEVSRRVSKPLSYVSRRVELASLPAAALRLLDAIPYTMTAMHVLARLPESVLVEVLDSDPAAASDCELAKDAVQRAGRDLRDATFDANDCTDCERNENGLCLDANCFDEKGRTAAAKAIKKLRAENPDAPVVVSCSTALGADKATTDFLRAQGAHRLRGKRVVEDGSEPAIMLDGNGTIPKLVHVADVASTDGRATRHTAAGEASIDLRKRLHAAVEGDPRPVTDRQLSGLAKALAEAVEGLDKLDAIGTWAALLKLALPVLERRLLAYSDHDISGDLKRIAALLP